MATKTQLKFYKVNGIPASNLTVGGIYFDKKTGFIHVATSSTATDIFGSKLSDAQWNASAATLSLTKADGSSLELDFSDMASSSAVTESLAGLQGKIDAIEASVGLGANGEFTSNATHYGDGADTIGGEIKNIDAALNSLANEVGNMATSDVVEQLTAKMTNAEADITNLKAATAGYNGEGAIASAISAAQAAATTAIGVDQTDNFSKAHAEISSAVDQDDNHTIYTLKLQNLVDSETYDQGQNAISGRIDGVEEDVSDLNIRVDALSSATHFEGVVDWNPAEATIGQKDANGDYTIKGAKYQSGDVVIYKPADGQSKEYILDGSSATPAFIELGDTTATDAAITAVGNRVTPLEEWKEAMTKADGTLVGIQRAIDDKLATNTFNTFIGASGDYGQFKSDYATAQELINEQFDKVDGITGFDSDNVSQASYSDPNYLNNASTLKDADEALAAALKDVSDRVGVTELEVASVEGDAATISVSTDGRVATVSALTNTMEEAAEAAKVGQKVIGLATAADVFAALCWEQFD